ncbi:MAG: hypothetical protein CFK49_06040 [Armatimonadetes bacterium JP3_11]|jgi:DNA-binding transcriptional MerR regulator|nr:MAG: hypothetical protein CFK48_02685 [Armatimonadetes bacterium CP1_7O]OYT74911.1 MAG: hypothetical protein CFK49_06040 [Armatimonadetes bacterium JP3_11]RMH10196.1 MAG: hypothetical protein D6697_01820 [Armatimonadota bacterium]
MPLEQQQRSVETERSYSPEEAGEILKIAANLRDDSFSIEHLRAIAQEAGITEENLQQAVRMYEERQKMASRQRARTRTRLQTVMAMGAGVLLFIAMMLVVAMEASAWHFSNPASKSNKIQLVLAHEGDLLASSEGCKVYRTERISEDLRRYELVRIENPTTGDSFVVGNRFQKVVSASISPSGKHVALYDEGTGEIWVVGTDGKGLQRVARVGQTLSEGTITDDGNPIAGWARVQGKDFLKLHLAHGGTAVVFTEQP